MDFNRNHFFIAGTVILLLGIQFRLVDSYVLNAETTRVLATRFSTVGAAASKGSSIIPGSSGSLPRKTLRPPEWLGWALMSIGSVLILHSLAMPKPGG